MSEYKKTKAIGWTALVTIRNVDFLITVNSKTRREAIQEVEQLTNVPIVMSREVQRCAVMKAQDAPKDMKVFDWHREAAEKEESMTPDNYECRSCHQGMYVPDGMDPLEEDVRYCSDCMVVELERLQAGLPKTADGVPMVPNMSVWIIRHGLTMERRVRSITDVLVVLTVGLVTATRITVQPYDCYSTLEAAEKARQSNG